MCVYCIRPYWSIQPWGSIMTFLLSCYVKIFFRWLIRASLCMCWCLFLCVFCEQSHAAAYFYVGVCESHIYVYRCLSGCVSGCLSVCLSACTVSISVRACCLLGCKQCTPTVVANSKKLSFVQFIHYQIVKK